MTWFDVYLAGSGVSAIYWGAFLLPKAIDHLPELQEHVSSHDVPEVKKQAAVRAVHVGLVMVYLIIVAGLAVIWPLLVPVKGWAIIRSGRSDEPTCVWCDDPLHDDDESDGGGDG